MGCCACVEESHIGFIESFGKFTRIAQPGLNCINCCTEKVAGNISLRVKQRKIDIETRSKDNVFVTIKLVVQFKVAENAMDFQKKKTTKKMTKKKDKVVEVPLGALEGQVETETDMHEIDSSPTKPLVSGRVREDKILYNAYYKLRKPVSQIMAFVEEYFRFHGMNYTLDEMFAAKNDMTHELQYLLNEKMNPYGYIISDILVIDIDPDKKVKEAMNDIIASEKEKRAQQSRAEASKITTILAAEAEARSRELAGVGIANARKAVIAGLQESVEHFKEAIPDTNPNQIMDIVLMTQYLDTIKEAVVNGRNTLILPSSPAQISIMEEELKRLIIKSGVQNNQSENKKGKEKE